MFYILLDYFDVWLGSHAGHSETNFLHVWIVCGGVWWEGGWIEGEGGCVTLEGGVRQEGCWI